MKVLLLVPLHNWNVDLKSGEAFLGNDRMQ